MSVAATAIAGSDLGAGSISVNFYNTVDIVGIIFTDTEGNVLSGTIDSALGFRYDSPAAVAVPEPAALSLLLSGLPVAAGYFLKVRRRRSQP